MGGYSTLEGKGYDWHDLKGYYYDVTSRHDLLAYQLDCNTA